MFFRRGKREKKKQEETADVGLTKEWPMINCTLERVRHAIRQYHQNMPKGVSLSVLVNEDNTIEYKLLTPYLGGIPRQTFYMSKETYELFDSPEIPRVLDRVQRAVDRYIKEKKAFPIIEGDPYRKVSYLKLGEYLEARPDMDTYLTDVENMITHVKPKD